MAILRLLALALMVCATPALAQSPQDWESQWDLLVSAAREEGKVVILAPPDPQLRTELPAAFRARFGVTVEYLGGRSSESSARLRTERQAGVYTVDAVLSGIQTMATIFYRENMLAPLKAEFILPEVVDGSKWKRGEPWFVDPEKMYVLRLFDTLGTVFYINTNEVDYSDLRSSHDLLDPKWKGKIIAHDPTVPGTGSGGK
jgi:iron(III) transport system substrate-binding protein